MIALGGTKASGARADAGDALPHGGNPMRVQQHEFIDLAPRAKRQPASLDRRGFLRAATALAATTAMAPEAFARNFDTNAEPTRYPDPDVVMLDKRFKYKLGNTPIMRLYHGTLWAEGPAWNGVGRYLLWSDIPNDEQLRWLEEDGHVARRFRAPSGNSNGNTFDYQAGRSPSSTATAASCATSTTAPSPCWPASGRASRSTLPTTPPCIPTAASGSPTPATAAS